MDKIVKQPELIKALGVSRGTLFNMRRDGTIPAPRKISSRCVGWLQSEIDEWLKSRPSAERFSGLQS
ncbi:helix-turn-helix transcriptional regulator [Idiomarina abyssalis]|uniref:helix-turn-helix transcriptional regulator n=1 Tax=Idiomarina abyssalis TaxID=86102 RepID=UPI001CD29AAE